MADWIFKPAEKLADVQARCAAELATMTNTLAMAKPEDYAEWYRKGIERLQDDDMLTLDQAAAQTGVTPEAYEEKAAKGEAILIAIEGVKAVPAWSIEPDGTVDPMKLDIAREIDRHAQAWQLFGFIEYCNFMTEETADITEDVAQDDNLKAVFVAAGQKNSRRKITVEAPLLDLVEQRKQHPAFQDIVAHRLALLLTYGGWENDGSSISPAFMDKYAAPAATPAATPDRQP